MYWEKKTDLTDGIIAHVEVGYVLRTDLVGALQYLQGVGKASPRWSEASTKEASERWDRGLGYEGALKMAYEGWPEGRQALVLAAQKSGDRYGFQPSLHYDIQGVVPCVPTYLTGDPENMLTMDPQPTRPVCRVSVEFLLPWHIKPEAQANYGAAILGAVESLELQGVTVELQGICSSYMSAPDRTAYAITWALKSEGQMLDIDRLAFTLAHAASSRRIAFALLERCPELASNAEGYGDATGRGLILDDVDVALPRISDAISHGADFMKLDNATKFVENYFAANSKWRFH